MDRSAYCIDLLCTCAFENPKYTFLVIGKGNYFKYNKKPDNVYWINKYLNHEEIIKFLNMSRCALMLTRRDTQGVMACELATYGMPLITSDLPVCMEFFDNMPNVEMISNKGNFDELGKILKRLETSIPCKKNTAYFADNTIGKEVKLINGQN